MSEPDRTQPIVDEREKLIVYDFIRNTVSVGGNVLKCMCMVLPEYIPKKPVASHEEHYEPRFLLRLILMTFVPKLDSKDKQILIDGKPQYYEWDQIAVDPHMILRHNPDLPEANMYLYKDNVRVATFPVSLVVQVVGKLGMTGYKDLMIRLKGEPYKELQMQANSRGLGQRVCPGLDFEFFDDKIVDPWEHSPDEPYLALLQRRTQLNMGIGDIVEDLKELYEDVEANEGEIKVQKARHDLLHRELRSVIRAIKKCTHTDQFQVEIVKREQEFKEIEEEHRKSYKHTMLGMMVAPPSKADAIPNVTVPGDAENLREDVELLSTGSGLPVESDPGPLSTTPNLPEVIEDTVSSPV